MYFIILTNTLTYQINQIRELCTKKRVEKKTTCFRKPVIVFCIVETKSWKSLMEGLVLFLEVIVMFPRLSRLVLLALQKHVEMLCFLVLIE